MAQGNIIQGQAKGKLGDIVLMVRKGKQVERVYTESGARRGDAASEAARYQRVRFGAAANEWDLYRYICTGMYRKGIKTNQSDYNYFVKKNISNLPFISKSENANGIHCVMPGMYSEGNLGMIELMFGITTTPDTQLDVLSLYDSGAQKTQQLTWTKKISDLKTLLKSVYPNSTKITYVISSVKNIEIDTESTLSESQYISRYVIKLDLYKEITQGENELSIVEYFNNFITDEKIVDLVKKQTRGIIDINGRIFRIEAFNEDDNMIINNMSVLVFATNDNVSDCYTTIMPAENVPNRGAFTTWYGYRTMDALVNAAQSYGYQTGTMRDDIAKITDNAVQTINKYAQKLAKIDAAAAANLEQEIAAEGENIIKSSRKKIEKQEES